MQLIEGRKIYLLNLVTIAIPWLERQIAWKLKSSNTSGIAWVTVSRTVIAGAVLPFSVRCSLEFRAVTGQVIRSSAFMWVGLCWVCCWAVVAAFVLFLPTQPGCVFHAQGCLTDCSTVTAASCILSVQVMYLCVSGVGLFWGFLRKRQVQRRKDGQKQTEVSCSPVVGKTYCGK